MSLSDSWPYDLVEIKWFDAETQHGWENARDVTESEELVTTVGFLIKKTRTSYIIGASICYQKTDEDHAFNARIQIPKGMVKKGYPKIITPKNTEPTQETPSEPTV